ncbi:MAG: Ni/Fe hydrogenase [Deltaproteobacteria bacterium]|nr:MAG: Ni/Fe hydrogenase [Deltaproteobacteria bacterium]
MRVKSALSLTRRDFLKIASGTLAYLGFSGSLAPKLASALEKAAKKRQPVIWLHFASDTGCTESLIKADKPTPAELVLDILSIDYNETIMAAAGHQAEENLNNAVKRGGYICVVEGGIPTKEGHGMIAGKNMYEIMEEVGKNAVAVVAIGACSFDGGIPAGSPNPSAIIGVREFFQRKGIKTPVINLPGCPVNPEFVIGTVVHVLMLGKVPELDKLGRPKMYYGRTIHDNCPRRAHFDKGQFVEAFGSKEEAMGYCLYKMGCKGPETYSECPRVLWNARLNWCIGAGSPCIGCMEPKFVDNLAPFYSRLANISLPSGDVSADKIGIGMAVATGVIVAGHAIGRVVTGGKKKEEEKE